MDNFEITEPIEHGLTDEEMETLEQERKNQEEASLAPFREFKRRIDATSSELTDLQLALVEVYETVLGL